MSDTRAHREPYPVLVLPTPLSAEAARALLALLQEIARVLETHYAIASPGDDHRPSADRQLPPWPEQDPPF